MYLGLLSYYEGGANGPVIAELAQAPVNTAAGVKRFVVPRDMAIAAKRLGEDHAVIFLVEMITTNGLLQ